MPTFTTTPISSFSIQPASLLQALTAMQQFCDDPLVQTLRNKSITDTHGSSLNTTQHPVLLL
eukprot:Pgem_evm1s11137